MPMSGRGSDAGRGRRPAPARGFTLIELLIVLVLVAIGAGVVSLALRDRAAAKLEEEGARLAALLEGARTEARAAGLLVRWVPDRDALPGSEEAFRFVGLPESITLPRRWLDQGTSAQVVGASALLLGPDAILPPQRVLLSLEDRRIEVGSDGLGPFVVRGADADALAAARP
jgi:general secretion pathway protein H